MKAIILAAGKGTRLKPLTSYIPKVLLPVYGRPILDYIYECLSASDRLDEAFIAVSDHYEALSNYLTQRKYPGKLRLSPIQALSWETGGDLRIVIEQAGISDKFLVCNGDVFAPIRVDDLLEFHEKANRVYGASASMVLKRVKGSEASRHGVVETDGDMIREFVEKPKEYRGREALVNAGYYVFSKEILEKRDKYLPAKRNKLEESVLAVMAKDGKLAGIPLESPFWIDVGTMQEFIAAQSTLQKYYDKSGLVNEK